MTKANTDIIKMLATSAVTVLTTYQTITAHIDATVESKVVAATVSITQALRDERAHADSTSRAMTRHMEQLKDEQVATVEVLRRKGIF